MEFSTPVEETQGEYGPEPTQKERVENPTKQKSLGDLVENNYSDYADKAPREQRERKHEQHTDDFKAQEYAGSQGGSNGNGGSVYNSALAAYDNGKKGGCDCCENLSPEWKYHK